MGNPHKYGSTGPCAHRAVGVGAERTTEMRRVMTAAMLAAALMAGAAVPAAGLNRTVRVQVDGEILNSVNYIRDGVTYVPLRTLLDVFGGWELRWDGAREEAVAESETGWLTANPALDSVTVNGYTYEGTVTVENGRTYVPLRLIAAACGGAAAWDGIFGGAAVTSPNADYDAEELYWLSRIISAESGGESLEGRIAVGNVVLNRVASSGFPDTVRQVVFDRKDAVQFEPVSNGTVYNTPTDGSVAAAKLALDGVSVVGKSLYFYAPALSQGLWINGNRTYYTTVGCHRFYL